MGAWEMLIVGLENMRLAMTAPSNTSGDLSRR